MSDPITIYSVTHGRPIRQHRFGNVTLVAAYGDEEFAVRFRASPARRCVDVGLDGVSTMAAPAAWMPASPGDMPRGLVLPAHSGGEIKAWAESREGGRRLVFTSNVAAGVATHTGHAGSPLAQTITVNIWTETGAPTFTAPAFQCRTQREFERAAAVIRRSLDDLHDMLGRDASDRFDGEFSRLCAEAERTTIERAWDERWAQLLALSSRYRGVRRIIEDDDPFRGGHENYGVKRSADPFRGGPLGAPVVTGAVGAGSYVAQPLVNAAPLASPVLDGVHLIHWVWWDYFKDLVDAMHATAEQRFVVPEWARRGPTMANLGSTPTIGSGRGNGQAEHHGFASLE